MKIFEILETDKMFEALKTNGKARKAIKSIKPIKPSKETNKPIEPIKSQPPPTPEKARVQSKKDNVERAEQVLKKERTVQKWNKKQRD